MRKLILIATIFLISGKCFSQNVTQSQLKKAIDSLVSKNTFNSVVNSLEASIVFVDSSHNTTFYPDTIQIKSGTVQAYWVFLNGVLRNTTSTQVNLVVISNFNGVYKIERNITYLGFGGGIIGNGLGITIINGRAIIGIYGNFPSIVRWTLKVTPI